MANFNVNRNVVDPFYRYKMPRILAKVEGKGNGIKTVIANMPEVAKSLERPPTYPTKYFGCELGAQTNFDLKNDRYIVNGEHDANKLQEILDGFIKKFVLCPACDNPETTLKVKGKTIHSKCKACGHAFIIDPKHKLSTFIIKNPPKDEDSGDEKEKKENGAGNGSPTAVEKENGGDGFDFPAEAITNGKHKITEEDDDWEPEPLDDEAKKNLSAQIGKLVLDSDLEKSEGDRIDMFFKFLEKAKEDGSFEDSKKLLNEAERLEVKEKAPMVLVELLFDTDVLKQIKSYRTLLLRFCLNDQKAQKYLLHGIECLISKHEEVLLSKAAHIIKKLYDEDICTEDVILSWGSKPSKKYVTREFSKKILEQCKPVLNWLEEAEEGSDTEGEDEGVEFDDRARQMGTMVQKMNGTAEKNKPDESTKVVLEENGEEIDIDEI